MRRLALFALLVLAACKGDPKGKVEATGSAGSGSDHFTEVIHGEPCKNAQQKGPIAWIEDDYASALACAKQKKLPLVLDLWAPWCHTCIAMQTTVFMDPSMEPRMKKFVFAALDTDREENAAAVGKFSTSAMPTFYVIAPDETVLARFVGAATLDQFQEFLDSGLRSQTGSLAEADAKFLAGQRAMAKKDYEAADKELSAALELGPQAWLARPEVIYYLQMVRTKRGDHAGCMKLSDEQMDAVGQTAIATNFWQTAIDCATAEAKTDAAKSKAVIARAIAKLQKTLDDTAAPLSPDDRAEALGYLRDALDAQGKKAEAKAAAEKARTFIDEQWTKAATPFARMAWAWPRAEVYGYLGRPLDLVADYEKLATDLPKEYEPRARLGWLYLKAGNAGEAAKWTDLALARVYGPRKGRLLNQRAEIAALTGEKSVEKMYREQAVKLWETLPEGQRNADALAKAKAALAAVDAPAAGSGSAAKK
ncbi:MAG TPA: thioredoxin family protein [Kofleriaceae bacterium]|nr:thioredoxin family protein [Kofleriaceae bacterium]